MSLSLWQRGEGWRGAGFSRHPAWTFDDAGLSGLLCGADHGEWIALSS